jgi:hypothetical protein
LVSLVAIVGACDGDKCRPSENHCDGDTTWNCFSEQNCQECDSVYRWIRHECTGEYGTCVEITGGDWGEPRAFCAASDEPEVACSGEFADGSVCVGGVAVTCRDGYRTGDEDCGAPGLCVDGEGLYEDVPAAFCVLEPEPTVCCATTEQGDGSYCSTVDEIECRDGYPVRVWEDRCTFTPDDITSPGYCIECGDREDTACAPYLCDAQRGVCQPGCPCAPGYLCNADYDDCYFGCPCAAGYLCMESLTGWCHVDETAPPCSDGCGLYGCVEELDRCATHCMEDADCAPGASCVGAVPTENEGQCLAALSLGSATPRR